MPLGALVYSGDKFKGKCVGNGVQKASWSGACVADRQRGQVRCFWHFLAEKSIV